MAVMKNVISQLIDDFHERNLPELVTRNKAKIGTETYFFIEF
jgi:hypothetical protein